MNADREKQERIKSNIKIDVITRAKMEGRPLMILSTDFSTAFDSIPFNHIENSLRFIEFPDNLIRGFMKLVNNGTLQVEVNNSKFADYRILSGTGQGDPKSSYTFNCSVAPLNYLIIYTVYTRHSDRCSSPITISSHYKETDHKRFYSS